MDRTYKGLVILLIVIAAFHYASNLLMPVVFAGLFAILFNPLSDFFERFLPRGIAAFLTVLSVSVILLAALFGLVIQGQEIAMQLPELTKTTDNWFDSNLILEQSILLKKLFAENKHLLDENLQEIQAVGIKYLKSGLIGLKNTLLFLMFTPIYMFFMLLCKRQIFEFFGELYAGEKDNPEKGDTVIKNIKGSLYDYLRGLAIVITITGTLTGTGLYLIGIEYAFFCGALVAFLTPIPYIGVFTSSLAPITIALLTKDSLWYAAAVVGLYLIVQFIEAYVVIPKVMSSNVNINPLMIILLLIFLGAIIGILGMMITVPLLAVLRVLASHSPRMKHWEYLLRG
jgi:predicted PurR-regulated permease PerM